MSTGKLKVHCHPRILPLGPQLRQNRSASRHGDAKSHSFGWCYQGHNAAYLGRAAARTLILLPDGTSLPARAVAKVTGRECGGRGVAARLARFGAPAPDPGEVPARWLGRALSAIGATTIRHPGNHRYAWRLRSSRGADWGLPVLPYPKAPDPLTRKR